METRHGTQRVNLTRYPSFPQRLDVRGKIKILHGQNRKTEDAPLALFAVCTPFGPPSLLELPQKEIMYKSKHKLDLSLVSMDQK
ncbi:Aryl hydrocarbon receptor [Portunus trituberculatus]|uniref:Aryl hydrocarbon receptor n=1 Tax=Portunus trituberculatus TaxID=210409 RepID=A0A5B7IJS6_PORTR|nr:Aryl hydrocarbon receptor [Portunus trituberculatus]